MTQYVTTEESDTYRPTLVLQTIYFDENDRLDALRLGRDLYHELTRPVNDPLAYGAGIPVWSAVAADRVNLKAAEIVVLIPVLGGTAFHSKRTTVTSKISEWYEQLGDGHVLIVPLTSNWRSMEGTLPVKQFLTELYGQGDKRRKTMDEIVLSVTRLLEPERKNVRLFVSHAKADLAGSGDAAKLVHDHIVTETTGHAFFDTVSLLAGRSLADQLDNAVADGVFLAIHGDAYSSRIWCQRELLTAKQHALPSLTVEVMKKGEQRSSPYAGNGPTIVWDGNPEGIASRAMIEWLRSAHFRKEGQRLIQLAELPNDTVVLARPPELLDLARGSLVSMHATLAMHPDPELSTFERQILKGARPRLQLATPTTVFRRLLNRNQSSSPVASPLENLQVALSLSDSPDVDGPEGFTAEHVRDATIQLARSLISAGASIAYGGDFRMNGFTWLLADLIQGYNQTAATSAEFLHNYLAAPLKLKDVPDGLLVTVHHLAEETDAKPDVRPDVVMPSPSGKEHHPESLYYSDMRQVMSKHTFARIVLGGAAIPTDGDRHGYRGRFPGVVEEAWWTLKAGKPLYVVGGFGGAAALVADLLEGDTIPDRLYDKTWKDNQKFQQIKKEFDKDPYRTKLGLPRRSEDLAKSVMELAQPRLADDESSVKWNGLTVDENLKLMRSRDPVLIASMVLKGLLSVDVDSDLATGKLQIELVEGSVTSGSNLDAIAVAVFDKIPLGGAGAALDQVVGGRVSAERAKGRSLISLESPDVDADWLLLASLGTLDSVDGLEQRVREAALDTANQARRHGFQRLGVVAFGGAVLTDVETMADSMLSGLAELGNDVTIVWFETDAARFDRLQKKLSGEEDVLLTTRRVIASAVAKVSREEELILQVSLDNDQLTVTTLPPSGSAIASSRRISLTQAQVTEFSNGRGSGKRATPDLNTLNQRGVKLAETLLGKDAAELLMRCSQFRTMIIHDVPSSKLPFEIMAASNGSARPAVQAGISRRLVVDGVPMERLFAKQPKSGPLNVLLIVNPTEDPNLSAAKKEADAIKSILIQHKQTIRLTELPGKKATVSAVGLALGRADILHYCGHAFFDGGEPDESGLILADDKMTLANLVNISSLPRVSFVNACESVRVRGTTTTQAAAFAELFLRSGVEAYLGTYWEVGDAAAAQFAAGVYAQLAAGQTLESAVTRSRADLLKASEPDWANYVLYGDGRFKLVVV